MVVELIFLIVLVVGIVLVGVGLMRSVTGYGRRLGAAAGGVARGITNVYQYGRRLGAAAGDYGRYKFRAYGGQYPPNIGTESARSILFGRAGESIIREYQKRKIDPTGLELPYEGVVFRTLRQHGEDVQVEPELGLLFQWIGHYARSVTAVVKGWLNRRNRNREIAKSHYYIPPEYFVRFRKKEKP